MTEPSLPTRPRLEEEKGGARLKNVARRSPGLARKVGCKALRRQKRRSHRRHPLARKVRPLNQRRDCERSSPVGRRVQALRLLVPR